MGDFDIVETAASIAQALNGERRGNGWIADCPVHGGHSLSIAEGDDGKLLFYCFGGGCEFADIAAALREYIGLEPLVEDDDANYIPPSTIDRIQRAAYLYRRGVPASGTAVETYLRSRGITLPVPSALRFLSFAPHRCGRSFPAMLAPVVNVNGEGIGVHLTFLDHDGNGKYPFEDPALQRESRGPVRSGAVRLADLSDVSRAVNIPQLIVAEGIETALSCMQMFDIPAWAALSTSGLRALELPPEIKSVIVAADNDANGAGYHAATEAYWRWVSEGCEVRLIMPPTSGTDFNDILTERGGRDD